jgi:Protein of unknown function (DUF3606)
MADDLKETGKPDDSRINVKQEREVSYWKNKLGVTAEQLKQAVRKVGDRVKDVRQHFHR